LKCCEALKSCQAKLVHLILTAIQQNILNKVLKVDDQVTVLVDDGTSKITTTTIAVIIYIGQTTPGTVYFGIELLVGVILICQTTVHTYRHVIFVKISQAYVPTYIL